MMIDGVKGNNDNDACQDVSNDDVLKGLHWGRFVVMMMMMMTKMMMMGIVKMMFKGLHWGRFVAY